MEHIRQIDIINIGACTGQKAPIFLACDRCAKYFCGHAPSPPPIVDASTCVAAVTRCISIWRTAATIP